MAIKTVPNVIFAFTIEFDLGLSITLDRVWINGTNVYPIFPNNVPAAYVSDSRMKGWTSMEDSVRYLLSRQLARPRRIRSWGIAGSSMYVLNNRSHIEKT